MCALLPGVSRSGSTIAVGMLLGLRRNTAVTFSFLMAVIALGGGSVLSLVDLLQSVNALSAMAWPLLVAIMTAAVTGCLVVFWFLRFVQNNSLKPFACYCAFVSLATGIFLK